MSVFGDAFSVGAVQVVLQGFKSGLAKQVEANHISFQVWYLNSKAHYSKIVNSVADRDFHPRSGFFHPGSMSQKSPGSLIRIGNTDLTNNLSMFNPKFVTELSDIWSGMFILDIKSRIRIFSHPKLQIRIWIHGSKTHWIPDPQHG